jgi:hypothetical protein
MFVFGGARTTQQSEYDRHFMEKWEVVKNTTDLMFIAKS